MNLQFSMAYSVALFQGHLVDLKLIICNYLVRDVWMIFYIFHHISIGKLI